MLAVVTGANDQAEEVRHHLRKAKHEVSMTTAANRVRFVEPVRMPAANIHVVVRGFLHRIAATQVQLFASDFESGNIACLTNRVSIGRALGRSAKTRR